ncbi:arylsulfatase [Ophiocordyceps sinensis CO18]|nr:arylsulfatase [Ophiocordyceps sinensis CO18]
MLTHIIMDEFLLHASTFALAVYLIVSRVLRLISQHVPDALARKRLRRITFFGFSNFIFGYLVWLMDGWACRILTKTRHSVGLPWAFLLELHGWWHIFTAIGGYTAVAVVDMITSGEVNKDATDDLAWPVPLAAKFMSALQGQ